ncbi:MAG: hypothetical protein VX079_09765 [Pseudomonadota bacterium]|nr:hypothetical protein [Pseudomonadota bacterium]
MVSLKNVWVGDAYGQLYHVLKRHVRGLENELKSLADYLDLITSIGWDLTGGAQADLTVGKEHARTSGNFDTMRGIVGMRANAIDQSMEFGHFACAKFV